MWFYQRYSELMKHPRSERCSLKGGVAGKLRNKHGSLLKGTSTLQGEPPARLSVKTPEKRSMKRLCKGRKEKASEPRPRWEKIRSQKPDEWWGIKILTSLHPSVTRKEDPKNFLPKSSVPSLY